MKATVYALFYVQIIFFFVSTQLSATPVTQTIEAFCEDSTMNSIITTPKQNPLDSTTFTMTKSSSTAVWKSLVLPGWGQYYNEQYYKAVVAVGIWGGLVGGIIWNNARFNQETSIMESLPQSDISGRSQQFLIKEYYRDQRDVLGLWLLGIYALATIDAYVGSHIYDFDVSEKGVACIPYYSPIQGIGLQTSFRW